jgi:hypothetical protein
MQQTGTIEPLNPDIRPYSFVARSEPTDVARVESRTFVCSESEDDAGPTNNWMAPEDMRQELLALKAGAMAVGAEVELIDVPGYMPYHRDPVLDNVLRENCLALTDEVPLGGHSCGSTDMGDFSCIHPTTNLVMGGVSGSHHHKTFTVEDKVNLYVLPAKALAITVIDLLYDGAGMAKEVLDQFEPVIPRDEYTAFMKKLVE